MRMSGARSANRDNRFPLPVPKYGEAARGPARDEGGFPARESGFCSGASTTKKHSPLVVVTVEILVAPFLDSGFRIGICEPVESLLLLSSPATASRASLLARPLGGTRDGRPWPQMLSHAGRQATHSPPQPPQPPTTNPVVIDAQCCTPVCFDNPSRPAPLCQCISLQGIIPLGAGNPWAWPPDARPPPHLGSLRRRRSHEQSTRLPPYRVLFPKHLTLTNRFIWYGAEFPTAMTPDCGGLPTRPCSAGLQGSEADCRAFSTSPRRPYHFSRG
jgi:hypothetical protein